MARKDTACMNIEHVSVGRNPPHEINTLIEVPLGGEPVKYELDKKAGVLFVDRFLYTPMRYPGNYGFIPHSLSLDGDPLDVLIANTRPVFPGALVAVRPIGVLKMIDEAGEDEKIIAVPTTKLSHRYMHVENYTDMPEIVCQQIEHFFTHYKELEPGKWTRCQGWGDVDEAKRIIDESIERAKQTSTA